ncbi:MULTISPECIES: phospholipase A [unclassified Uliginosibacterium]|uniref:phospholipase A n=1 Tax=unclassified Uliginosibacterium TaxID=2621521 RepID=UPI0013041C01|nr:MULTISPECIES: phospholipase A [unclassified Uliginosibacterium]MDO6387095.1 phospholipase A [Uliginosibacterium sp. 31-12]
MKQALLFCALALPAALAQAETTDSERVKLCMIEKFVEASPDTTVGQIRSECQQRPAESFVVERAKAEQLTYADGYAIAPHKPNYMLGVVQSSHTPSSPPFQNANNGQGSANKTEAEFQISLKFPIIPGDLGSMKWMVAYTNRSFWQVYNENWSRPFRETNHEPETWLQFPVSIYLPGTGLTLRAATVGFNHQSNGQTAEWSRSWNRITSSFVADSENFALVLRPWWRIPESAASDDNPDINHYLGNFDLNGTWRFQNRHRLSFMLRNNLEFEHNRGGYELSYGIPIPGSNHLRLYFQGFSGYGKSLISYNHKQESIGAGIELVDW